MNKRSIRVINAGIVLALCVGLPLAGIYFAGIPVGSFLQFPPPANPIEYPGFSIFAFALLALATVGLVIAWFVFRNPNVAELTQQPISVTRFPWWGWGALFGNGIFWVLAWNRFTWFAPLQLYTFTPLWLFFIILVNAMIHHRCGACPLLNNPKRFLLLFPVSAAFWWGFEYFNRFAHSWLYEAVSLWNAAEYFFHATLAFSTVLPAVYSVRCYLKTFPSLQNSLARGPIFRLRGEFEIALILLVVVVVGLLFIGLKPFHLFPVLWAGPILAWLCLNRITRTPVDLGGVSKGDWRVVLSWAFAALICGFFWEMWNFYSLARWVYQVPYFSRFYVFEMPSIGYTGYLPFGLECAVITDWVLNDRRIKTGEIGHDY